MWQFYTERGKRVIQLARSEAINLGHDMVEPEHILLGVLQEGSGIASQALDELGVDPENLAAHIRDLISKSRDILSKPTDLPLSQRTTRALDMAVSEARKMGDNYVDIYTEVEYAPYQEYGTSRGIQAKHFMKNGITENLDKYKQIIEEELKG